MYSVTKMQMKAPRSMLKEKLSPILGPGSSAHSALNPKLIFVRTLSTRNLSFRPEGRRFRRPGAEKRSSIARFLCDEILLRLRIPCSAVPCSNRIGAAAQQAFANAPCALAGIRAFRNLVKRFAPLAQPNLDALFLFIATHPQVQNIARLLLT